MSSYSSVESPVDLPSAEDLLSAFGASDWLKQALASALLRDPVDACTDAELLSAILDKRANEVLMAAHEAAAEQLQ